MSQGNIHTWTNRQLRYEASKRRKEIAELEGELTAIKWELQSRKNEREVGTDD